MSKINATTDHKIQVYYKDVPLIIGHDETSHSISPYRLYREGYDVYLVYHVTNNGKTLRSLIESIHQPRPKSSLRKTLRQTFNRSLRIDPLDLLLKLIDTCENLLISNKLLSQAHINPDLIWIDYDNNHNIIVKWLDILECDTACEKRSETIYWSPELLRKRNHLLYFNSRISDTALDNTQIKKQTSLKRYDTRPSTLSTVYSLGLIMYFIITAMDPYVGSRIHVDERPDLIKISPLYNKIIWTATHPDPKDRPTLKEFREMVVIIRIPKSKWCI